VEIEGCENERLAKIERLMRGWRREGEQPKRKLPLRRRRRLALFDDIVHFRSLRQKEEIAVGREGGDARRKDGEGNIP
jgi:hypothetical protein